MKVKIITIFLGSLLIIILVLYNFFTRLTPLKNNSKLPSYPTPSLVIINRNKKYFNSFQSNKKINTVNKEEKSSYPKPSLIVDNKNNIYPTTSKPNNTTNTFSKEEEGDKFYREKIFPKVTIFNPNESSRFKILIDQTPIDKPNYSIFYSPIFNKIYFKPKNKEGEKEIEDLIKNYQLGEMINKFPQNFIIDKDITSEKIDIEEISFLENQEKYLSSDQANYFKQNLSEQSINIITPYISPFNQEESINNSLSVLAELFRIILNDYSTQNTNKQNNFLSPTISFSPSPSANLPSTSINNLYQLFNDVGRRVGVPPKILEGVMTIEMPSTFKLSPEQILLYSQPSNRIPGCGPNHCSATGPMQMTTGIDNSGSPRCLRCGLTSCPNAWASYGNAVNIFTNDKHIPNPCNLRDNVFAAAYKLKTDSRATDPINWTQEQVFRAATRYYGSCSDRYRFPRFNNRTYCEFLWWYYTNK